MAVVMGKPGAPLPQRGEGLPYGFFKAVRSKNYAAIEKFYSPQEKAALNENSGLTGGYLVPQGYSLLLFQALVENSFLWPRATVWPMTTLETLFPRPNAETVQTAGTSPFFGGMLFQWGPSQGSALTETEPTFNQLSLKANDLTGYLIASNQLMADMGPEGEQALIGLCGQAAAWYAEYAFFNGTGTANKQPLGIINSGCAKLITRNTSSQVKQVDLASMAGGLLPYSWSQAIWACSPSALLNIVQTLGYTTNETAFLSGMPSGSVGSLYGRPLFVTDKLPAVGTRGDVILLDPSLYVIGDRQQVLVDISDQTLFNTFQTVLRVWLRLDGKPALDNVVTLADGTTTASAFVVLV